MSPHTSAGRIVLPTDDRVTSPFTGYTRAHWLAAADGILAAAQAFASPGRARISPPGTASWSGPDSDALEGFARTFLLLAFRVAGEAGVVHSDHEMRRIAGSEGGELGRVGVVGEVGGGVAELLAAYAEGLAAGTDPGHPEAWPRIDQDCRQTLVEAYAIAAGLQLTRPWLWDRLDDRVRQRVVDWLGGAFGLEIPDNNWHLFRMIVGDFLAGVGAPHDRAEMDADRARIEEFYVGDGWYRDGPKDAFDNYCGWALHTKYVLWATMFSPDSLPPLRDRLHRFLTDFGWFFGSDGAPLHQGRSLIYRWAAAAAPWAGALVDATPLSPGTTRRLASGTLRHFLDRGALDPDGVPSLGWYGAFPPLVQGYSGPASPYWSSLGFLGLLLPADHPCWTAVEEPLPAERADSVRTMPAPGFLLSGTVADGIVRVANHGSDNHPPLAGVDDPHYSRFAYSTATGPAVGPGAVLPDNHVALVRPDGAWSRRTRIHRLRCASAYAASYHEPVWPDGTEPAWPDGTELVRPDATPSGARIETASVLAGPYELRAHLVDAPADLDLLDAGWQIAHDAGLSASYLPLHGIDHTGTTILHGASAFGPTSAVPHGTAARASARTIHVALHTLTTADQTAGPDPATATDQFADPAAGPVAVPSTRCGPFARDVAPSSGAIAPAEGATSRAKGQRPWCEVEEIDGGAVVTAGLPDGSTVLVVLGAVPAVRAEFAGAEAVWFARRTNQGELVVVPG
jgi:hypothetical protein